MDFAVHSILCPWLNNCKPISMQDTKDIQTIQISLKILLQYSSVNGAEYVVGQENIYEDPCDDWLDLINKQITSPNYPKPYEPLTYCNWNLTEKHGYYISLDFEKIDVS